MRKIPKVSDKKRLFDAANCATYDKNTNSVWIPYGGILSEALPSSKGSDNRVTERKVFIFECYISC